MSEEDLSKLLDAVGKYKDVERTILDGKDPTEAELKELCEKTLGRKRVEESTRLAVLALVRRAMGAYMTDRRAWESTEVHEGTYKDIKPHFKAFLTKWTIASDAGDIDVRPPSATALEED
jgi:hypothetical protein